MLAVRTHRQSIRTWPSQPYRTRARAISVGKVLVKPRMTNSHVRERMTAGISPARRMVPRAPVRDRRLPAVAALWWRRQASSNHTSACVRRVRYTTTMPVGHSARRRTRAAAPGRASRRNIRRPIWKVRYEVQEPITDLLNWRQAGLVRQGALGPPCGSIPRASVRLPRPARRSTVCAVRGRCVVLASGLAACGSRVGGRGLCGGRPGRDRVVERPRGGRDPAARKREQVWIEFGGGSSGEAVKSPIRQLAMASAHLSLCPVRHRNGQGEAALGVCNGTKFSGCGLSS